MFCIFDRSPKNTNSHFASRIRYVDSPVLPIQSPTPFRREIYQTHKTIK